MSRSKLCQKSFVGFVVALGTTGCSSTLTALTSPSISSDQLDEFRNGVRIEKNKIKTMSGDRRLMRAQFTHETDSAKAISKSDNTLNSKWIICAETQADAIAARGGQSAVTVSAKGSLTDEYVEALTVTNNRGQVSDVVRQIGWQVCNAYMNGALTKQQYGDHLIELHRSAFAALIQTKEGSAATLPAPVTVTFRSNVAPASEDPQKSVKP